MHCKPGAKVAGHTVVRGGIDAVGSQVYFEHIVVAHSEIFGGRCTRSHFFVDDDDAVVRRSHADFILGAYHAHGFYAAYFRFLNLEFFVAVVEFGAHGGHNNSLPGGNVGRAAHYLLYFSAAEVDGGHVQVVAVGMVLAAEHFADDKSAEASAYAFYCFYSANLKACRGEDGGKFVCRKFEVYIVFQPGIGYIHCKLA